MAKKEGPNNIPTTYDGVAKVFSSYDPTSDHFGGFPSRKDPRYSMEHPHPLHAISEQHSAQQIFSREQEAINEVIIREIRNLTLGRGSTDPKQPHPPLSERIQAKFAQMPPGNKQFGLAIARGYLDVLTQYRDLHPQHMPAFKIMFDRNGTLGSARAITMSANLLSRVISGTLAPYAPIPIEKFISIHPDENTGETIEDRCTGPMLAQAMCSEAWKAATALAQIDEVRDIYTHQEPDSYCREMIETHVEELAHQTWRQRASGALK